MLAPSPHQPAPGRRARADDSTPGAPAPGLVSERMQALLSRAVEEQVSEQRSVSAVLADLRREVADLAEGVRLAASESSLGVLARRLDERDVAAARSAAPEQLTVSPSDLRAAVETGPLAERLSSLSGTLEEVQQQLSQVVERIAELGAAAGELPALSIGMTALRSDVEQLTSRLAGSAAPGAEEIAQVVDRRVSALLLESEGRVIAHVDDAVLVLAEALLRRRRNGRGGGAAEPIGESTGRYADAASDHDLGQGTAPVADELGAAVVPARGSRRPAARMSRAPGRPRRFEAAGPPIVDPARPHHPRQEGPTQEGPTQKGPTQTQPAQEQPVQPHEPAQLPQAATPTQPSPRRRPWWRPND